MSAGVTKACKVKPITANWHLEAVQKPCRLHLLENCKVEPLKLDQVPDLGRWFGGGGAMVSKVLCKVKITTPPLLDLRLTSPDRGFFIYPPVERGWETEPFHPPSTGGWETEPFHLLSKGGWEAEASHHLSTGGWEAETFHPLSTGGWEAEASLASHHPTEFYLARLVTRHRQVGIWWRAL